MHTDLSSITHGRSLPSHTPLTRGARRGFALIVTLGLMTLLLLLVLTLTTLVRINMITANSNLVSAQARQNALLAAYIGMGQLQKFAGPDQRATANAYLCAGGQHPMDNDSTRCPWIQNLTRFGALRPAPAPATIHKQSNEARRMQHRWHYQVLDGSVWGPGRGPVGAIHGSGYGLQWHGHSISPGTDFTQLAGQRG